MQHHTRLKRRLFYRLRYCLIALTIMAVALLCIRLWPRAPLSQSFASSTAVYDTNGRLLRLTLSDDDKFRLWTPLKEISPTLVEATLLHEDRHFKLHPGINPFALGRGAWRTYFTDERRQGGSTITMQLARLKYRLNSRSVAGKVKQIARAIQLEMSYSKNDILEAYLNLVPYGANIEGVGAASLIYFSKRAEKLTLPEALAMTVIPQSPARRGGLSGSSVAPLVEARAALFKEWVEIHPGDADKGAQIAVPFKLGSIDALPFSAPHAVESLLASARVANLTKAKNESATEIRSTIDLRQQRLLERHLRAYVAANNRVGIRNASAMLLDTRTMAVKAVVGSADFFNADIDGQVNGTLAKRSPGSTLKPFVYALGIDQGVLHPATVLRDLPSSFGPFSPENFDGQFVGPITAHDALIKSRNIPAVQVASKLSKPSLYDFLKTAGVTRMKPEAHYGLALVLGGGEVTMEELVTLYASLANRGELKPIKYSASTDAIDNATPGIRMMSEEAAYITLDILKDNPRPSESTFATKRFPVAWKTGTSYGFRDAWSVGVFGPYVLAVWIGNFDGEANPAFIGAAAAAPLFFQIVDSISADSRNMADALQSQTLPKRLTKIDVCTASGDLPNAACPQTSLTWFIPGVSPIRVSTLHRKIAVDNASGLQACNSSANVRYETYEYWSSDMQKLFRDAGLPRRTPPAFMPQCHEAEDVGSPPKITSPLRGVTYTLREFQHANDASPNAEQSVNLRATTDADTHEVFWFADQTFIGRAKAGAGFAWRPSAAGNYTLRAVDDHGRADSRELRVTVVQ